MLIRLLLLGLLVAGGYFWLQSSSADTMLQEGATAERTDFVSATTSADNTAPVADPESTEVPEAAPVADQSEVVAVIDVTTLPPEQQRLLAAIGIGDVFTVTTALKTCVATKLGTDRLDEILAGATPGVIEVTQIVSCL